MQVLSEGPIRAQGDGITTPQSLGRATPFRSQNRQKVTIKMIRDACRAPRDQGRLVINNSQVYTVSLASIFSLRFELWLVCVKVHEIERDCCFFPRISVKRFRCAGC